MLNFLGTIAYTLLGDYMSKESFKIFVKNHPSLIKHVNSGNMTWQKFYELHDMYGENNDIWGKYLEVEKTTATQSLLGDTSLKEVFNAVKKIDLDTVKRGVDGLQKAVSLIQDLSLTGNNTSQPRSYERRPMYKYFED